MLINTFKNKYCYALIRYVPNIERGEGLNAGLVIRDGKEQRVLWNKDFTPHKEFRAAWNKSAMTEWEEFYKEEMTVIHSSNEKSDNEKLSEDYWNTIRRRCPDPYVLSDSMFVMNNVEDITDAAQNLFERLAV